MSATEGSRQLDREVFWSFPSTSATATTGRKIELIAGHSRPEDGAPRYIGFVHGYDRELQWHVLDHLKQQGVQANQDVTFINDGGKKSARSRK
ncbi:hypothetical protein EFV37_31490 [Mesorhizobium loti]|uniref:Uncharacterized protein n=1 Tax=Rhizobium loti TaxID=381 RepID=M5AMB7_RHILI|nr:hypothetical protein A9174_30870 [Mesorhizobium loti NZP2037]OBP81312.1 hypothetical protein BAE41_06215 [Mesorhizobium loti]QKC66280.1 hypothetical protein EB229_31480 [Mesorhizobium jarvisii]OBP88360.1 hypothetical protein BAE38_14195 [Mesorhizobium loti]OBQ69320.1 hypothetical protein A9K72_14295 [Mesorhizobium loti]